MSTIFSLSQSFMKHAVAHALIAHDHLLGVNERHGSFNQTGAR
jgi:hypothetical protein